jgi:hypothetical protein
MSHVTLLDKLPSSYFYHPWPVVGPHYSPPWAMDDIGTLNDVTGNDSGEECPCCGAVLKRTQLYQHLANYERDLVLGSDSDLDSDGPGNAPGPGNALGAALGAGPGAGPGAGLDGADDFGKSFGLAIDLSTG